MAIIIERKSIPTDMPEKSTFGDLVEKVGFPLAMVIAIAMGGGLVIVVESIVL